jgi:membrane protein DedA with SNARE-associated domain
MQTVLGELAGAPLVFATCAVSGLLLPVPEDVPVLVAGIAASAGEIGAPEAVGAALAGVLVRDVALYAVGRASGEALLRRSWVVRLIGQERLDAARALFSARGSRAIFVGRFFIGFRAPVFVTAGALGVPARDFLLWDSLGLVLMVPAMFAVGFVFGQPALGGLEWIVDRAWIAVAAAIVVGVGAWAWRRRTAPDDRGQP